MKSLSVYQAIMKAADHIERNPREFSFGRVFVPTACGTPGCALGWIDFFLKTSSRVNPGWITSDPLGVDDSLFYARMKELASPHWVVEASECVAGLRLYAEKYHGYEKPQQRPTSAMVADLVARIDYQTVSTEAQSEELTW